MNHTKKELGVRIIDQLNDSLKMNRFWENTNALFKLYIHHNTSNVLFNAPELFNAPSAYDNTCI